MQENQVLATLSSAPKVDYYSFLAPTGYTQAAMDNLKSMQVAGVDIALRCVHGKMVGTGFSVAERNWLASLLSKKHLGIDAQIVHAIPPRWNVIPNSSKRIALFVFENEVIQPAWIDQLSKCMGVIVPSRFNLHSLQKAGLKNVHLVHHAVDVNIWNNEIKSPRIDEYKKIRVITVGTWRQRKNWKLMVNCMTEAFKSLENLEWTIKVDKINPATAEIKAWLSELGSPDVLGTKIKIDSRILDEASIARLVGTHDILLSASLGEGFGLPALQASFLGLPVVCPRHGGYEEFFDPMSYFEIKASGFSKIPKMDNLPQFDNLEWPIYDKDSILDALYLCIGNLPKVKELARIVAEKAAQKFNHKTIGTSFLNVINSFDAITSNKN
jgi:glycosyltransferase involved in cell wall biosynthesis